MSERELPTEPGSVIGWSLYYDGERFGSAVLDWGDNEQDIAWWRSGFEVPLSATEMAELVGDHWQSLGRISLCPFVYPEHCHNHDKHVKP